MPELTTYEKIKIALTEAQRLAAEIEKLLPRPGAWGGPRK